MTIGSINKGAIIGLMAVIAIAGGFAMWNFKYKPAKVMHEGAIQTQMASKTKVDGLEQQLAQVEQKGADNSSLSRIIISKVAIPQDEDGAEAIMQLNMIAKRAGVTLTSVQITSTGGANADGSQSASVPIDLTVDAHATYTALSMFLQMLQEQVDVRDSKIYVKGRLMNVTSLELGNGDDAAAAIEDETMPAGHIKFSLTIQAYADNAEASGDAAGMIDPAAAGTDPAAGAPAPGTDPAAGATPASTSTVPPGSS